MNELRPISVIVDGKKIADGLRVHVRGSLNMTLLPDFFMIEIYNLSTDDSESLKTSKEMTITGEGEYVVCSGEIENIYTHPEGTNTVTCVAVVDGETFWNTRISKTVGGGADVRKTILEILSNATFGGYLADNPRIERGQTYVGRLAENISMLAKTGNGRAFQTKGVLYVVKKGNASEIVKIEEEDIINDQNFAKGSRMVKVSAKGYPVGALVEVSNKRYRLVSQKIDMDNYKYDWASTLVLVDEDEVPIEGMVGG